MFRKINLIFLTGIILCAFIISSTGIGTYAAASENLALGATAYATNSRDNGDLYKLAYINDGKSTRWQTYSNIQNPSIIIDLGTNAPVVNQVKLAYYSPLYIDNISAFSVTASDSIEGENATLKLTGDVVNCVTNQETVVDKDAYTTDNWDLDWNKEIATFTPIQKRYICISLITDKSIVALAEIELYNTNLAMGASVSATTSRENEQYYSINYINDGKISRWQSLASDSEPRIILDLGANPPVVDKVKLAYSGSNYISMISSFSVTASDSCSGIGTALNLTGDIVNCVTNQKTLVDSIEYSTAGWNLDSNKEISSFSPVQKRYICISLTKAGTDAPAALAEIELYSGDQAVSPAYMEYFSLMIDGEEFNTASQVTVSGEADILLSVMNNTNKAINPVAIAATYDDNVLKSVKLMPSEEAIKAYNSGFIDLSLNIPDGVENGSLQVFLLNDLNTITPLSEIAQKAINTDGKLCMPTVFSDEMVLQRDEPVKIFGQAPTGSTVTVTYNGSEAIAIAENNRFTATLEAQSASAVGKTLQITAQKDGFQQSVTYNDVVVGDVFYGSGQSNMRLAMSNAYNITEDMVPANVRYFTVAHNATVGSRVDRTTNLNEEWIKLDIDNLAGCSAVMYHTANNIRNVIGDDVPIGIIVCAKNASSISAWIGKDLIDNNDAFLEFKNTYYNRRLTDYTGAYFAMAKSIIPYTVKAAVWYQGEADRNREYQNMLGPMIENYRKQFGKQLPYFVVQLPGYGAAENWYSFRLKQAAGVDSIDDAYIVITNDTGSESTVGENSALHPQDKDKVGDRVARVMLHYLYGEKQIPYYGPMYKSMEINGDKITLSFDYVNDGVHGALCSLADDESLEFFEIAGEDGVYYPATASIDGDNVIVYSEEVTSPKNVRFAYVNTLVKSLGTNTGGVKLPLAPFRTDGGF